MLTSPRCWSWKRRSKPPRSGNGGPTKHTRNSVVAGDGALPAALRKPVPGVEATVRKPRSPRGHKGAANANGDIVRVVPSQPATPPALTRGPLAPAQHPAQPGTARRLPGTDNRLPAAGVVEEVAAALLVEIRKDGTRLLALTPIRLPNPAAHGNAEVCNRSNCSNCGY